jgi:hypothetical protein
MKWTKSCEPCRLRLSIHFRKDCHSQTHLIGNQDPDEDRVEERVRCSHLQSIPDRWDVRDGHGDRGHDEGGSYHGFGRSGLDKGDFGCSQRVNDQKSA